DIKDELFVGNDRKTTLFTSLLFALDKRTEFKQRKSFDKLQEILDKYKNKIEGIYKEVKYDIFVKKNKKSLLEYSPGQRAQEILKLTFNLIEENINNGY